MQDTHPIVWMEHHSLNYSRVLKSPLSGDSSPHLVTCCSEQAVLPPGAITKNGLFLFFKSLQKQSIYYGKKFTIQK